jgi:YidC/Oxa1 family membrane protein insertase
VNDDAKQHLLLIAAVLLTVMFVFQIMVPPPETAPPGRAPAERDDAPAPGVAPATVSPSAADPSEAPTTSAAGADADGPASGPDRGTAPAAASGGEAEPAEASGAARDAAPPQAGAPVFDRIRIRRDGYAAVFSTRGAALRRIALLDYSRTPGGTEPVVLLDELRKGVLSLPLDRVGETDVRGLNFRLVSAPADADITPPPPGTLERNRSDRLVFRAVAADWEILRTYTLPTGETPGFTFELAFRNLAEEARPLEYLLAGPAGLVKDDATRFATMESLSAAWIRPDPPELAVVRTPARSVLKNGPPPAATPYGAGGWQVETDGRAQRAWLGLKNRFFTALLVVNAPEVVVDSASRALPLDPAALPETAALPPEAAGQQAVLETALRVKTRGVGAGETVRHGYRLYAGPAEEKTLLAFDERLRNVVSYTWSWFDPISRLFAWALDKIALVVRNYGVAIIILTLLVRSAMHPLTRKSLATSHKMQKVQPKIAELKKKYAGDKQKLNQETMRLFQEEGVSPMSGCMPLFLQMPIFIALFGAFARGFAGRHEGFLWIDDLTQPDAFLSWSSPLPLLGLTSLNLLPLLSAGLQFLQMNMQPKAKDPQAQQQQQMMKFMPVFLLFIFYSMPAGLVLYFTVSSGYTLAEHWLIKRGLARRESVATSEAETAAAGAGVGTQAAQAGEGTSGRSGRTGKRRKK